MSLKTAKLQRITVRQAAEIMSVSERTVYMARKLARLRHDLEDEVVAGRLSLNAALRIAENRAPEPRPQLSALRKAWAACSDAERNEFVRSLDLTTRSPAASALTCIAAI